MVTKKRGLVLSLLTLFIIFNSLYVSTKITNRTPFGVKKIDNPNSPQSVYRELSVKEGTRINKSKLLLMDREFNNTCTNLETKWDECFPYVIYSYVKTRNQLLPNQSVHTRLSQQAYEYWEDFYHNHTFNNSSGLIINSSDLVKKLDFRNFPVYIHFKNFPVDIHRSFQHSTMSLEQFRYFIDLVPKNERQNWSYSINKIYPNETEVKVILLITYTVMYNAETIKQIPQKEVQESIFLRDLCSKKYDLSTIDQTEPCQVYLFFRIREFCDKQITEKEIVLGKTFIESPIYSGQFPNVQANCVSYVGLLEE